jgi:GxxExxY protein
LYILVAFSDSKSGDMYYFSKSFIVNDLVIIEVKSVESLMDVHHKQLLTYLKLSNKKLGLLIDFNSSSLKDSITRIVNNL